MRSAIVSSARLATLELGPGGQVEPIEEVLELHRRMRVAGRERALLHELAVLVEAGPRLLQELRSTGVVRSPSSRSRSLGGRADPVPEDREEGGVLEDGVAPLHPPERADVLEETDLEAHGRDSRVDQAPVSVGQLPGHDEVPAHEGSHHEEEAGDGETELMAEAQ